MAALPELMHELDHHLQDGMAKADGPEMRGRYADALLGRAERLFAEVYGHEVASARHAVAARKAHQRATAMKGRCRR